MEIAAEPLPSVEDVVHIKPDPEEKPAVTPPPSVVTDKPDGASEQHPNDEVDPVEDDIGEVTPDHYYGDGEIPVFKPTMKQFESFPKFIRKIDKYGMQSGIVKVVPPQEWRDSLSQLDQAVKTIKVKNPITQEFHGQHGIYTQANMEKQRSYNLPQWKTLTEESNHQPPAKRGERRRNQEKEAKRNASLRAAKPASSATPSTPTSASKRTRGRLSKTRSGVAAAKLEAEATADGNGDITVGDLDRLPTPASPADQLDTPKKTETPVKSKRPAEKPSKAKNNGPKSVSSRRTHNTAAQVDEVDEEAFRDFDYRMHDLEEWTADRCKELEVQYWKSLNFSNPMYGADMPGSLFDDSTTSWNVAKLENLLDVLGTKVPGVNTAYLYLGMWRATFAWHLEDVDLYSINYIHFGAPKQWYSISQRNARKFEKAMKNIWSSDAKNCDQFLRHKTYLVSPQILKSQYGVEVNRLVHYEGEFVITFPYGYHSGYNIGYNCAESVNFATEAWLEYGKIARKCNCEADSVWVDVYDIERKLRGEPTPEYEEEYFDEDEDGEIADLPTPPLSDKDQVKPPRKRKLNAGGNEKSKRVRLTLKSPPKPVCALCPNDYSYEQLLRTEEGEMAHRLCALYVPETYVTGPDGHEIVAGVRNIDKKRLELKCLACRSKHGAVFQCSHKKCARAYHATCAAQAGVSVEIGMTSFYGEDGTEYQDVGIDFRCRFHRPKRSKYADENTCVEALEKNAELQKHAQGLQPGDSVQYQYFSGDIHAGYVIENRESEQTVLLYMVPQKHHIEVEYKYVLYFDKVNQQLKPPSKDALPMPAHLAHKSSTTQDDPTTDAPKMDEPFNDPSSIHKWSEFNATKLERNPSQLQVDFSNPNTVWHYLGNISTEARAHYTHDPLIRTHNTASNFLDTVVPTKPPMPASSRPHPTSNPTFSSIPGVTFSASSFVTTNSGNNQIPPKKRPRGRPPGSKNKETSQSHSRLQKPPLAQMARAPQPWVHTHLVDPTSLRNQQEFMAASGMYPGAKKPLIQHPMHLDISKSVIGHGLGPDALSFIAQQQAFSANGSMPQQSPNTETTHFSRTSMDSHTPPSTMCFSEADPQDAEFLKKLAPYPCLLRWAKQRPAVYQSPYGPPGVINDAFLPLPRGPRPSHARHTSLSQDFLSTRSPSQQESMQGHVRTVSTEKATLIAQEAERRQRESMERQRSTQGSWFGDISSAQKPSERPLSTYTPHSDVYSQLHAAAFPNQMVHPSHTFQQALHPRNQALQFSSPQDFQQQMARESTVLESREVPRLSMPHGPDSFSTPAKNMDAGPTSHSIRTPPPSSHNGNKTFGGNGNNHNTDGTSGSPLRVGHDGAGGETLPVMRGSHDD